MAASFRRINVDQYDEENIILPNDLVPENPLSDNDLLDMVQAASQQARSFLQRGDTRMALATVLSVQPYGSSPALTNSKVRSSKLD
jgi:ARP2/3 complex 16 kDa subunit (p16-Arc)